jgi:hypothetical protein
MRNVIVALAAVGVLGLSIPAAMPAKAEDRVVIKAGERHHHHRWMHRDHHKEVVIIKKHRRHHDS